MGEIPGVDGASCILGSLNLKKFIIEYEDGYTLDLDEVAIATSVAIKFLDNVVSLTHTGVSHFDDINIRDRKVGLGVMGWADVLAYMNLPYDSDAAREYAKLTAKVIYDTAVRTSQKIADARGAYPGFSTESREPIYDEPRVEQRNTNLLSVAPTGTISLISEVNHSIEPFFMLAYQKNFRFGNNKTEKSSIIASSTFEEIILKNFEEDVAYKILAATAKSGILETGDYSEEVNAKIVNLQPGLKVSHQINPEDHVLMQSAWQLYVDQAISKCLAEGTLIETDGGLVAVEDFSTNCETDSFMDIDGVYNTSEGHKILKHYCGGVKKATKVRLNNGAEITGSYDSHRVLTVDGWRKLSDLSVGDLVLGKLTESHGIGGEKIYWEDVYNSNANNIITPKEMSVDLAKLIGMLCADGSLVESTGSVGICNTKKRVIRLIEELFEEIFRVSPNKYADKRNEVVNVYLTSRNLVRYFKSLMGNGAFNKYVPTQILRGSPEEKIAFLEGLTLDGYVAQNSLVIYEGRSKKLASQVFSICQSFGMPKIYLGTKELHGKYSGFVYGVRISNELHSLIIPIEEHKRIKTKLVPFNVCIKSVSIEDYKVSTHNLSVYSSWRRLHQDNPGYCSITVAENLGLPWEYLVHKVTEVTQVDDVMMYDVEVEDSHRYIVDGIVSHNTINLPNDATVEDIISLIYLAWSTGIKGTTVYRDQSRQEQIMEKPTSKA